MRISSFPSLLHVTASKTLFPPPLPLSTFTPSVTCSISILITAIALQTKNSKFPPPAKLLLLSSDYTDRRLRGFLEYRDGKASGKLGGVTIDHRQSFTRHGNSGVLQILRPHFPQTSSPPGVPYLREQHYLLKSDGNY